MSDLNGNKEPHTLWLVRHGYRQDMADASWRTTVERPFDAPLAPQGIAQAREVGARLKDENIHHIFSSPFLRAVQTAHEIADVLEAVVHIESGLSEVLLDTFFPTPPSLLPPPILAEQYSRVELSHLSRVKPQYPETMEAVGARMHATLKCLMTDYKGNLLMVSHGGPIDRLCHILAGPDSVVQTACCSLIKLVQKNEVWHLEADGFDRSYLSFCELRPHATTNQNPKQLWKLNK